MLRMLDGVMISLFAATFLDGIAAHEGAGDQQRPVRTTRTPEALPLADMQIFHREHRGSIQGKTVA